MSTYSSWFLGAPKSRFPWNFFGKYTSLNAAGFQETKTRLKFELIWFDQITDPRVFVGKHPNKGCRSTQRRDTSPEQRLSFSTFCWQPRRGRFSAESVEIVQRFNGSTVLTVLLANVAICWAPCFMMGVFSCKFELQTIYKLNVVTSSLIMVTLAVATFFFL